MQSPFRYANRVVSSVLAPVSARAFFTTLSSVLLCLAPCAEAASVGPGGYTNDFNTAVPSSADWSTAFITGAVADVIDAAGLDAAVQLLNASGITTVLTNDPGNPPAAGSFAAWSSSGHYLQTRPTSVKMSVMLATLVNNTGTNANCININYDFANATSVAEQVLGHRVYYNFNGAAGNWVNISALDSPPAGRVSTSVNLSSPWNNGATLYLLWADDNGSGSPDNANQIDNFYLAAYYTNIPLSIALTVPANGQHFGFGSVISATLALTGSPTNVSYYIDGGLAVARTTSPFTPASLPAQGLGSHTIYATARDAANTFLTTTTNTFFVDLTLSGTLTSDTTLYASNSPYTVSGNLTVPAGVTLTIEPGVTLLLASNVRIIANGRLVAAGTPEQRIRFTRASTANWSGLSFSGNHQSNVLAYVDFEYANASGNGGSAVIYMNDSQLNLDRCTFLKISVKYFDIWYPQFILRHSVFGDLGGVYFCTVENLAPNGWFIVDGNLFGLDTGDNDIFHLNHISVKNGPVAQIINNVFTGAGDDHIDDNESDSHIEGNLFLNYTTNHPARSAAAAITTGEGSGNGANLHTQRLTVVRNIFWGCDYGIINKDGSYVQVYNCVFVNNRGGIIFDEPWRTDTSGPGRACYIEGSIFWNNFPENGIDQGTFAYLTNSAAYRTGAYYQGATQVQVNNSILPAQYHYLGTNNIDADPQFAFPINTLSLSPTNPAFAGGFDGFDANAFIFTNHLIPDVHLLPGSPAIGAGVNGSDMGIYVSDDATITGEPASPSSSSLAGLTVGGLDICGYKYRLVGDNFTNDWSPEMQSLKYVYSNSISGTRATAYSLNHGFSNGDVVSVIGADSLCPYYNGTFPIFNATANTFDYTVDPGTNLITSEPLSITWPIRNEKATDIWCWKPQRIELAGLSNGDYRVEAIRENTMGVWQSTNAPTISRSWTVSGPLLSGSYNANTMTLRFLGQAGQAYTVQYSDSLNPPDWHTLRDIPAPAQTGEQVVVDDNLPANTRFYRVLQQ